MWYETGYRRHLCDMHIEDWNEEFLSKFSPKEYCENLKKAKIDNAMLYFQSHVGLCNYPTRSGKMHGAFRGKEDTMRKLSELLHENGMTVTGYYSLIYNNYAHDTHPAWRMVEANGSSQRDASLRAHTENPSAAVCRYGLCCPNNREYRAFVKEQIHEIADCFTVEGMFYDMPFWPHICLCESCKKRWKEEVGGEIPTHEDPNDKRWLLHLKKRREWMGDFTAFVTEVTKEVMPDVSVEYNFASAVYTDFHGCAAEVNAASDYAGGDLYGDSYSQSFVCKFYRNISRKRPFEYMFSKCKELRFHTGRKSEDEMRAAVYLTEAHHGATLVIDAVNPDGTMDGKLYERLGKVFAETKRYEPYFGGDAEAVEDIGVYNTFNSRFNKRGEGYNNHECGVQAVKTLVENHVLCGVCGSWYPIDRYKTIVCPCLTDEDESDFERICEYVKNGGNLYMSGGDVTGLLREFFGAEVAGFTEETVVYIAPKAEEEQYFEEYTADCPLHFEGRAPIVKGIEESKILARVTLPYTPRNSVRFASIHSDPPGRKTDMPAMAFTEYGKGKVLWSALPIEANELYDYEKIFSNLVTEKLGTDRTVIAEAPENVEMLVSRKEDRMTVCFTELNVKHTAKTFSPFTVTVKSKRAPTAITLPEKGETIAYTYENGTITFRTKELRIFDLYEIRF